jgi:hypothetical protein
MQIGLDNVKRKTREICRDSSEYSRIWGNPAKIQKIYIDPRKLQRNPRTIFGNPGKRERLGIGRIQVNPRK